MNYRDFALEDLESARVLLENSTNFNNVLVNCQQFLEKYLKHLLILKTGEQSRTHKMTVINSKLEISELLEFNDFFRQVQDYYFDKKYPGENYIPTTKEECQYVYNKILEVKCVLDKYYKQLSSASNTEIRQINIFDSFRDPN